MLDQDQVQPVEKPDGLDEKSRSLRSNASPSSALPAVALDGSETGDSSPVIQLSKARQRVLMVTMASSGLLNVRNRFNSNPRIIIDQPNTDLHRTINSNHAPLHRRRPLHPHQPPANDHLHLQHRHGLPDPPLEPARRHPRPAARLPRRLGPLHARYLAIPFSPVEACFYLLRALQGLGGAAIAPSALGILAATFPVGKQRTLAFVAFSAASSVGSVLGNVAGGVIGVPVVEMGLLDLGYAGRDGDCGRVFCGAQGLPDEWYWRAQGGADGRLDRRSLGYCCLGVLARGSFTGKRRWVESELGHRAPSSSHILWLDFHSLAAIS